jgi:hypothetical protein
MRIQTISRRCSLASESLSPFGRRGAGFPSSSLVVARPRGLRNCSPSQCFSSPASHRSFAVRKTYPLRHQHTCWRLAASRAQLVSNQILRRLPCLSSRNFASALLSCDIAFWILLTVRTHDFVQDFLEKSLLNCFVRQTCTKVTGAVLREVFLSAIFETFMKSRGLSC